jgi:uncharacterized membrane protein
MEKRLIRRQSQRHDLSRFRQSQESRQSLLWLIFDVSQMKTEYLSRIDSWLAIVLIGAPLLVVAAGVFTLTSSLGAGIVTIITGLIVGGMIAALSLPCVYTLTDESLTIKSGMLEDEVPLRTIRRAEKSSNLWSAPALSLRRVKITLDDGSRFISPKDRDGFITDLEARLANAKQG